MSRIHDIINGWSHVIWPIPEVEEKAKVRLSICLQCEMLGKKPFEYCRLCNCPIDAKVRAFTLTNACKIGKWKAEPLTSIST